MTITNLRTNNTFHHFNIRYPNSYINSINFILIGNKNVNRGHVTLNNFFYEKPSIHPYAITNRK